MTYGALAEGTELRRAFADTSLGQIHYRTTGSGPPLVLLHNTWLSSRMFFGVIPDLARDFTIYALDTLGQGDSDAAPTDRVLEIPDYAQVLLEAFDSIGLEQPAVVGHHTGSVIASEAAVQQPQRFRKLVISGMPFWRNPATRLAQVDGPFFADWAAGEDGSGLLDAWTGHAGVQRYGEGGSTDLFIDYIKPGPRTSMALRALFRWDSQARLPLVTVPTLVLCSESDTFVKNIGHVAELIPNAELKIVAGGEPHPLYNQATFTSEVAAYCRP